MAFWNKINSSLGALKSYLSSSEDEQASDEEQLIETAESAEAAA